LKRREKHTDTSSTKPLARSEDLIVEELGDEVLVYDAKAHRGHSLTPAAAKVWRSCDGRTSAEELRATLGLESDTVDRALDELSACDLLEATPTIAADGATRREATLKLAKVGAVAAVAPLVFSVASASAATTASGCATRTSCSTCNAAGCCWCINVPGPDRCVLNSSACTALSRFGSCSNCGD
jgi:hypothetical protein